MKKREHSEKSKIASQRLQNFKSNSTRLSEVNNVTVVDFEQKSKDYNDDLAAYNLKAKEMEEVTKTLKASETAFSKIGSRFLTDVASNYGIDSEEYRLAGGTPLQDRKRRKSKKGTPTENGDGQ